MSEEDTQLKIGENKADIERAKVQGDFLKHLATLSTGSIVIIGSFLEKVFPTPQLKILVAVSLVSFLVCVVACLALYTTILGRLTGTIEESDRTIKIRGIIALVAFGGFLLGLLAFVAFFIKNFL